MDPDDKVLLEGTHEAQGDYIFTANKVGTDYLCSGVLPSRRPFWVMLTMQVGEYSFCFENEASMSDKLLDFE